MDTLQIIPPIRSQMCAHLLESVLAVPGHVIELGVYRGDTTYQLARVLEANNSDKRVIACDCFEGLPYSEEELEKGECRCSLAEFKENLKPLWGYVLPVVGRIEDTLESLAELKFCFAFLDLDLYASTAYAVQWLKPKLSHGSIVGFHDYGFFRTPGIEKAVREEFMASDGFQEVALPPVEDNLIFFRKS